MKKIFIILASIVVLAGLLPSMAMAVPTDYDTVRRFLTSVDFQDYSEFDQDLLPGILIDIIENDPEDAEYHERVLESALVVLGQLHVDEAIDVLIDNLEGNTTTCLYWLGTFASPDAVNAIVPWIENDDASIRYEAVSALSTLPAMDEDAEEEAVEEYEEAVMAALEAIYNAMSDEEDEDVRSIMSEALVSISTNTL